MLLILFLLIKTPKHSYILTCICLKNTAKSRSFWLQMRVIVRGFDIVPLKRTYLL